MLWQTFKKLKALINLYDSMFFAQRNIKIYIHPCKIKIIICYFIICKNKYNFKSFLKIMMAFINWKINKSKYFINVEKTTTKGLNIVSNILKSIC
jgi:hypothetical protein